MSKESKYASHLPVLKLIYSLRNYYNVLEFGCGNYSTKYFIYNCKNVTSIEMQNEQWFNKIKTEVNDNTFYMPKKEGVEWLKNTKDIYDLILVDGINRVDCINASFGRTDIIVLHDIGLKAIKCKSYQGIQNNNGYEFLLMNMDYPNTGIFTKDIELADKLKMNEGYVKVNI